MMAYLMKMPGPIAPAFCFTLSLALACLAFGAMPAHAQEGRDGDQAQIAPQPTIQVPPSVRPMPGQLELSKMLWSTVAAVDHANQSGNYSVLRDISAQGFQVQFNPARLTELFSGLRRLNVDLSNALLVPPTYYGAPQMVAADTFRVRGIFQLRPIAIQFEAYYQWEQGRWKLFGVELKPQPMAESQR